MKHLKRTLRIQEDRRVRVLEELHPELRARVVRVLSGTGGRLTPWEGFRSHEDQIEAKASGASDAGPGESPHNFRPALACDLVLSPALVRVRRHPGDLDVPDCWDDESPEALAAWAALDQACEVHGLQRVLFRRGDRYVRDLPHVQLFDWRSYLSL